MRTAADVCKAAGLGNVTMALTRVDPEDSALISIEVRSENGVVQVREVNAVNESGLYTLILGSRKPQAKPFQRWVTNALARVDPEDATLISIQGRTPTGVHRAGLGHPGGIAPSRLVRSLAH